MAASIIETETKYDAPAGAALPDFDDLAEVASTSEPDEQLLKAEYFDTEDLRLIRAGVTLRRRTGGHDAGWHLKLPAGQHSRTEIRLPPGRAVRKVPAELADLVRARTRNMPLLPVATLTTRRQTILLLDKAGNSLAAVADDEVTGTRHGESGPAARWREVEVELTGGDLRVLNAAGRKLRKTGLRPAASKTKLERVLGSEAVRTAAQPRPPDPQALAGSVVAGYLGKHTEALISLDPMVRRGEPDAVHQMRVATRRLRSTLRTFGQVLSADRTKTLAAELKWLGGVLGEARDCEVQAGRMSEHVRQTGEEELLGPVQARVEGHFASLGASTRAEVLAALNSDRYYSLLDTLDGVLAHPPPGPDAQVRAARVLPAAVGSCYRKTRRRMRRAARAQAGHTRDVALHEARKAAKQCRYAAEAAEPAFGRDARRFARRMKKLQSALGDHQDTVVGRAQARELGIAAHQAGESAFSYGLFYARELSRADQLRARAGRAWHKSSRRRYRSWLDAA